MPGLSRSVACHGCVHCPHHRCRGLHTCNTSHHACGRQVQMGCFHNMAESSVNRGAHWCASCGWVKTHAPSTTLVAARIKRKGYPSDGFTCRSPRSSAGSMCSAWPWYGSSNIQNTNQNLKPPFGFQNETKNEEHMPAPTVCAGMCSSFWVSFWNPNVGSKSKAQTSQQPLR
jgi:hypothetical protein